MLGDKDAPAKIAYDRARLNENAEVYTSIAEEVCDDMTAALQMTVKGDGKTIQSLEEAHPKSNEEMYTRFWT